MRPFSVIVAVDQKLGIGKAGGIPWRLPNEMKYFKDVTMAVKKDSTKQNAVIMGRKTWESIPPKFRPLPDRVNLIVSRTMATDAGGEGVHICSSLGSALQKTAELKEVEKVFVIGGGSLYKESLEQYRRLCHYVYLTKIEADCDADTFFPDFMAAEGPQFKLETESEEQLEKGYTYRFLKYMLINEEETQYLDMIRRIIHTGNRKGDRTGVGTISLFGAQMRFSLRDGSFPLLTSKRVFWRGVAEELLWFVKGDTNANHLREKDIHIWDGNGSRQFLDNLGLTHREEGDLGPVYGFQWRHFGATYETMDTDYTGKGVDQLQQVIETLRKNPNDRRIIMSAWNPVALPEMALPPCHCFCQFYVADGELSCQMYQRSCDMGLGVPFNIASYALLTCLIAKVCGLKPGDFIHTLGDAHVYSNHVDPLKEQLKRSARPFPTLVINRETDNIEDFQFEDLEILDYNPLPTIKMEMAV